MWNGEGDMDHFIFYAPTTTTYMCAYAIVFFIKFEFKKIKIVPKIKSCNPPNSLIKVKYANGYNFLTTSSVFMHSSRNAQNDHSMQQNHATEGEIHSVEKAACCFEFVPRTAGSTCGEEEGAVILKLKSCLGL